jgi:NAD-dependent DNA ligase
MSKNVKARTNIVTNTRTQDRLIDELIGICRGVIADDVVDESEVIFLGQWIENHRHIATLWPVNVLYARITEMLLDGVLTTTEQRELLITLKELTGESSTFQQPNRSTLLPIDKPAHAIVYADKSFCLTGRFVFASIMECEETIAEMGGAIDETPKPETNYLVIGEMCSPDWVHTTFGRSIEKAVELRAQGHAIQIVSEEHWVNSLG